MVPVFDLSRVIGWVKTVLLAAFLWAAFKALVIGSVVVLVPYAIYKSWSFIAEQTLDFVSSNIAGGAYTGQIIELTGLAGWMGERLQLQACFQILASFVMMRFVLSFFHKT